MMSLQEIVDKVMQYPQAPWIVLTGGEPSMWIDEAFIENLKAMTGKRIAIETNGTHTLPKGIDWVTLSPKNGIGNSGEAPVVLTRCDELKVVYLGQDLAQYDNITADHRYLQPCWVEDKEQCRRNMHATVQAVLQHPEWRLSLQTHRILGIK
jgi:organic radical activating enzyme